MSGYGISFRQTWCVLDGLCGRKDNEKVSVSNYNLVYISGDKEEPLLEHFDSILMPALRSGIVNGSGDTTYFLMDVGVKEYQEGKYALTGLLIKKTILEIKSDIDENGKLIEKDDRYPAAPFSMFIIYLNNHRMLFAENQKGSPDIRNFKATIKHIINTYVKIKNAELKERGEKELPIPILNVTGIPMRQKIDDALKEVMKIRELTLRFYPLNGDIDYTGLLDGVATDLRRKVGCRRGEIVLKSPKNIAGVIDVVSSSEGTVDAIFAVTYNDKRKGKIKNDEISENLELDIAGNNTDEEIDSAIEQGDKISSLKYTSDENSRIYEKNKSNIIPFVSK